MSGPADLVVSGVGVLTALGVGLTRHLAALSGAREGPAGPGVEGRSAGGLAGFDAARALADRRILKAISCRDALGMVALEDGVRQARYVKGCFAPQRVGLYVGAPPGSALDAEPYTDAIRAASEPSGRLDLAALGRACRQARPTALLLGLPNNVLCYGSIALDAQGPNSNYTSGATSGHLAVQNAALRLRRGQLDFALAGGFSAACDELHRPLFERHGLTEEAGAGRVHLADGGVFLALERRATAVARGAAALVTYVAGGSCADALGPFAVDPDGRALAACLTDVLRRNALDAAQVGLVLTSPTAHRPALASLLASLACVFPARRARPPVAMLRCFGHLMEGSGLLEVAAVSDLLARGRLPAWAAAPGAEALGFGPTIGAHRPYALVLAATASGEQTVLVVRQDSG